MAADDSPTDELVDALRHLFELAVESARSENIDVGNPKLNLHDSDPSPTFMKAAQIIREEIAAREARGEPTGVAAETAAEAFDELVNFFQLVAGNIPKFHLHDLIALFVLSGFHLGVRGAFLAASKTGLFEKAARRDITKEGSPRGPLPVGCAFRRPSRYHGMSDRASSGVE